MFIAMKILFLYKCSSVGGRNDLTRFLSVAPISAVTSQKNVCHSHL